MRKIANKEKYGHLIKENNGVFYVKPISKKKTITVLCPYCDEVHSHGIVYGHRAAHCKSCSNNKGYFIVPDFDDATLLKYNPGLL